jgi:hypothetical protein
MELDLETSVFKRCCLPEVDCKLLKNKIERWWLLYLGKITMPSAKMIVEKWRVVSGFWTPYRTG